jgi:hypothetical protein
LLILPGSFTHGRRRYKGHVRRIRMEGKRPRPW